MIGRFNFYSYLSNKRRVANNLRVWKKYLNLITKVSGTNGGPQHDELESNLKKIPHRNGIWGLEAIVM